MKNLRNWTLFHIKVILNETECSITLCTWEWYKRIEQITHLNANTGDKEIIEENFRIENCNNSKLFNASFKVSLKAAEISYFEY